MFVRIFLSRPTRSPSRNNDVSEGDDDRISIYTIFILFYLFVRSAILFAQSPDIGDGNSAANSGSKSANDLTILLVLGTLFVVFPLLLYLTISNNLRQQEELNDDGDAALAEGQRNNENTSVGHGLKGVSKEMRDTWKRYEWCTVVTAEEYKTSTHYGSTDDTTVQSTIIDEEHNQQQNESISMLEEARVAEEPSCCICLCEYEPKDTVIQLPCNHIFHEPCIDSWTDRNIRCPLCNCNLMEDKRAFNRWLDS